MINSETIGKIIKRIRIDNKLTQEALAEIMEISTNYLSKVERGLSKLNIESFLKMAKVVPFSLGDFGIGIDKKAKISPNKQKLLEKVLSIPEKDIDKYMQTISFVEKLLSK